MKHKKKSLLIAVTLILLLLFAQSAMADPQCGYDWNDIVVDVESLEGESTQAIIEYIVAGWTNLWKPSSNSISCYGVTNVFPRVAEVRVANFLWEDRNQIGWDVDVQQNAFSAYANSGTHPFKSSATYEGESFHSIRTYSGKFRAGWSLNCSY